MSSDRHVHRMDMLIYSDEGEEMGLVSEAALNAFLDDFMDLVEKHGLSVGGGVKPDESATKEIVDQEKKLGA